MPETHSYSNMWTAIVKERRLQGMTMHELSQRSGISEVTLGKWLRGETAPPYPRVEKLIDALGLNVSVWREIPWSVDISDAYEEPVKVPA